MIALAGSVFVAGLLGSVHCAGMCGNFACLASGGDATRGARALLSTAAYNGGRLLSYAALGAIAGAAGGGLNRVGAVAGVARPAAIAAGSLLIVWGVASLLATFGVRVPALHVPPALANWIARVLRAVQDRPPSVRALTIGVCSAALPCGWLYAFVATSAAAGSALGGAVVMTAFWAGTLPMMALVGISAQRLLGRFRSRLPMVTAATLVVLGALTVAGRFGIPVRVSHAVPSASEVGDGHDSHR
jgi:sulfite exporter TauE/SafE